MKYENLSYYENLWIVIHIYINLFLTMYKREDQLMKWNSSIYNHYNFSSSYNSFILKHIINARLKW